MSQSINLNNPTVHLCPHSHTWYARGLLNLIGALLLLLPITWQIFLLSPGPAQILMQPVLLKITLSIAFSFILEIITSLITKQRTYTDGFFLFSTLLLLISLPTTLPLEIILLAITFAYLTTKWLFSQKTGITPFVSTAYAFAFLTQKDLFLIPITIEFSPFITNFLTSYHLNSEKFDWLVNILGQTLNTFTVGYAFIAILFYFLKITSFRISIASLITYIILLICLGRFEELLKYPQILFALILIAGDTAVSPFSNIGKWIYGSFIGFFTFLLHILWQTDSAGYFAILMASLFAPLIDSCLRPILLRQVKKTFEVLL